MVARLSASSRSIVRSTMSASARGGSSMLSSLLPARCTRTASAMNASTSAAAALVRSTPGHRRGRGAADAQSHHHGQVVGGDPGEAAPVDVKCLALELDIPVDAVEPEEGEYRRMRAPHTPHRRLELDPQAA